MPFSLCHYFSECVPNAFKHHSLIHFTTSSNSSLSLSPICTTNKMLLKFKSPFKMEDEVNKQSKQHNKSSYICRSYNLKQPHFISCWVTNPYTDFTWWIQYPCQVRIEINPTHLSIPTNSSSYQISWILLSKNVSPMWQETKPW